MKGLLTKNKALRLGGDLRYDLVSVRRFLCCLLLLRVTSPGRFTQVMSAPWLKGLKWAEIESQKAEAPTLASLLAAPA
jgi:hypothetical protein